MDPFAPAINDTAGTIAGDGITPFDPIVPPMPRELPDLLLQFPMPPPALIAQALDPAGEAEAPRQSRQPQYPPWFTPNPPKPTQAEVEDLYHDRGSYYAGYVDRVRAETARLRLDSAAGPDEYKKALGDELFVSGRLRQDFDLAVNILAAMDEVIDVPFVDPKLEEATQEVEDWLYEVRDQEIEQHGISGRGALPFAEPDHALAHGKLATRVACVFNDPDSFFDTRLVDATQVFPLYDGKRGLRAVVHAYADTVANVIGDFDDDAGTIRKALTSERRRRDIAGDRERTLPARKLGEAITVLDYTDRWWHVVVADGTVVFEAAHKYGEVPWIITGSGYGNTAGGMSPVMTLPDGTTVVVSGADTMPLNNPDESRWRDCSFLTFRLPVHNQHEILLGRFQTELRKTEAPPIMLGQDDFAAERAAPKFVWRRNAVNTFDKEHETPAPMPTAPAPNVFGPLLQALQGDLAHGFFPDAMHGINDRSNVSGYAITGLNQSGAHHLTPWILLLKRHKEAKYRLYCRLFQRFGHLYAAVKDISGDGKGAKLRHRRPARGQPSTFVFHPEVLDRTGTKVVVDTTSLRVQDWGPFASSASQLVQMGIKTRRDIRWEMNDRHPDRTWREWIREQLDTDPDVLDVHKLRMAYASGDADVIRIMHERIASKHGPAGPRGGPPGFGPPDIISGGGLPPTTAGVSLPGYGVGPGPGSGPPSGPGGITPFPIAAGPPPTEP